MTTLRHLDDDTLMDTLSKLARNEREATAELLAALAEVDRRKLYAERGYSSLFCYCQEVLNMAEPSIYVRIAAARCCGRFPRALSMLRSGDLHLSAIKLLAPHLTDENCETLMNAARQKSKRQVEELVSDLAPKPDAKEAVHKLPASRAAGKAAGLGDVAAPAPAVAQRGPTPSATSSLGHKQTPAALVQPNDTKATTHPEPLGRKRYKVQFTTDEQLRRKIEKAQDLMRHKNPAGDLAKLFEAALDQLIQAESKRQHGATEQPRSPTQQPAQRLKPSRHIPNDVKREVFERDGGQCTFVSPDGHRCTERGRLQYHHEVPFAKGGTSTPENIRLLCACHNALLARHDYGERFIEAQIQGAHQAPAHHQASTLTGDFPWTGTGSSPATPPVAADVHAQAPPASGLV